VKSFFQDTGIQFLSVNDFLSIPDIIEDADSFEGNALKKARIIAEYTKEICLADDSGLIVDAIDGWPGIYSSRYAGEYATDGDNNVKLLSEMENIPFEKRNARYRCVAVIMFPDGSNKSADAECEGFITFEPKGNNGFGYDPVFYVPEYKKTMAELRPEEKNMISHRAKALLEIKRYLNKYVCREHDNP